MITLPDPMPFSDALNYLRDKQAVGSSMDTAAWREVPAAIRNKAFFSATLTSAQVARRMQDYIDDFLSQDRDVNERGAGVLFLTGPFRIRRQIPPDDDG